MNVAVIVGTATEQNGCGGALHKAPWLSAGDCCTAGRGQQFSWLLNNGVTWHIAANRQSGRRIPTFAANGNLGAISLIQTTPTPSFSHNGPLNNDSPSKHWQTTKMPAVTVFRYSLKVDFCPFFYKNISTAMSSRLWPQKMHR